MGERETVTIVGAGPVGAMLAVSLARRNQYDITVVERRADFRTDTASDDFKAGAKVAQLESTTKRSINLALSRRGIEALDRIGLKEKVLKQTVTMKGRVIHDRDINKLGFQPYGTGDQAILSVNRGDIACMLLDELTAISKTSKCKVEILFNHKITGVAKDGTVSAENCNDGNKEVTWKSDRVFGCDGMYSKTRDFMKRYERISMHMDYVEDGYKELDIPPTPSGDFALPRPDGLHIWPRGDYMLIALPNPDKSYTATVFAPMHIFDEIGKDVLGVFKRDFPTAFDVMPNLLQDWNENPTSALATVTVTPYNYSDKICILGDAAHATLPFYGQGMNCGFEDVLVFDDTMNKVNGDLSAAIKEFGPERAREANPLIALSNHNYIEMRDHTTRYSYIWRKRLDTVLHKVLGNAWIPLYTMVAFTRIPYDKVVERKELQDRIVLRSVYALAAAAALGGAMGYHSLTHYFHTGVAQLARVAESVLKRASLQA